MKKYLMEGVGTFILVLIVLMASNNPTANLMPLAYGAILIGLTFAGRPISGAHFNPAVSLAVLMRGKLERWDFPYYWIVQIAGGLLAALLASFLLRCGGTIEIANKSFDPFCALFAEALGTFILTLVFLNTTSLPSTEGNSYYGLAIGFAALASIFAFHDISLAVFNPAIALSMALAGMIAWGEVWVIILGALIGAAAGASIFRSIYSEPI